MNAILLPNNQGVLILKAKEGWEDIASAHKTEGHPFLERRSAEHDIDVQKHKLPFCQPGATNGACLQSIRDAEV